jgi:hypothetical protein
MIIRRVSPRQTDYVTDREKLSDGKLGEPLSPTTLVQNCVMHGVNLANYLEFQQNV